jgi:hypothetical protein
MATPLLGFLPDSLASVIQDGILERKIQDALKPILPWRSLCSQERHPGRIGERVIKTRTGLIQPSTQAAVKRVPGQDPPLLTSSVEQFSYQIAPYGGALDIHLPSSYLAVENFFLEETGKLVFHAAQTVGRICRTQIFAAYGGGDTFTTNNPGSVTAVTVKDVTGFDTVMVNGTPVAVSVTNTLAVTIGGVAKLVSACVANDGSSPPRGPGVLTITVAITYAQFDQVIRTDAPKIIRQNSRATDHLIVAGDTATIATFRQAAAYMRTHNVPGIDGQIGGLYGCFVNPNIENALFADLEFHNAINAQAITGVFEEGTIGVYAGIKFMRITELDILTPDSDYQTTIHKSLMFGGDVAVEAFIPESEFALEVVPEGVATNMHYKTAIDPMGVMTLVVRAPQDRAGEIVSASWLANCDYAIPTDAKALTGTQRVKRAVVVNVAGPA